MVKWIVELHGGEITVESKLGKAVLLHLHYQLKNDSTNSTYGIERIEITYLKKN